MGITATITVTIPVSENGHQARDKLVSSFAEIDGVYVDVFHIKDLTDELERRSKDGEQRCLAVVKKAGLKAVGRPDLSYGIDGGKTGPIEMWFQIQAEG